MSLEILNMLIEAIDSSRETICIGNDGYGEPECIDVVNADEMVEFLKHYEF